VPMRNYLLVVVRLILSGHLSKTAEIHSVYSHIHFDKGWHFSIRCLLELGEGCRYSGWLRTKWWAFLDQIWSYIFSKWFCSMQPAAR
jgi:hypothetical protein